jgi:hypothetical protein
MPSALFLRSQTSVAKPWLIISLIPSKAPQAGWPHSRPGSSVPTVGRRAGTASGVRRQGGRVPGRPPEHPPLRAEFAGILVGDGVSRFPASAASARRGHFRAGGWTIRSPVRPASCSRPGRLFPQQLADSAPPRPQPAGEPDHIEEPSPSGLPRSRSPVLAVLSSRACPHHPRLVAGAASSDSEEGGCGRQCAPRGPALG